MSADPEQQRRARAARATGLGSDGAGRVLDELAWVVAQVLRVPLAVISIVDGEDQRFVGAHGLAEPFAATGRAPLAGSFAAEVVERGAVVVVPDARQDPERRTRYSVDQAQVVAFAGQPLHDPAGEVVGCVAAIDHAPRAWTDAELEALARCNGVVEALIADRAGMSTHTRAEQARALEAEDLGRRLQEALLPASLERALGERVTATYQPGSERLLLGGDFADVFAHPDGHLGFVVGDVVGHGPESAALAISLRASWAALEAERLPLPALVERLNRIALRNQRDDHVMFATVLMGRLTPDGVGSQLLQAGHPLPVDLGRQGEVALPVGPPVGIWDVAAWTAQAVDVAPAGLLVYTDGLVEGRREPGSGARLGIDAILARLSAAQGGSVVLDDLVEHATVAHGGPLPDDVALLLLRPLGAG